MELFIRPSISLYKTEVKIEKHIITVRLTYEIAMIKPSIVLLQIWVALLINVEMFVPLLAMKKTSSIDGMLLENERTRLKENYVLQRAFNNELENNNDVTYVSEPLDPNANSEELPALIVDYANLIRNDIILLDKSFESRTRKRGNVKVQRRNKAELDVGCTCEQKNREPIILGDDYFPRSIETAKCNRTLCPFPYGCQRRSHNITVLKKKMYFEESQEELPADIRRRWVAVKKAVTVGCICTREQTDNI